MDDFYDTYGRTFDLERYTRLAAKLTGRPMALLNIMDETDQFMWSEFGVPEMRRRRVDRCDSICHYTAQIPYGQVLAIPDASSDERVKHMPSVAGEPHHRWYLGTPLVTAAGKFIGVLCVLDTSDNIEPPTEGVIASLLDLAGCIMTELELREDCNVALKEKKKFLTSVSHELRDPMHGITMSSEILSSRATNGPDEVLALQTIRNCSTALENLIDNVLLVNRSPASPSPTSPWTANGAEDVSISAVTEDTLDAVVLSMADRYYRDVQPILQISDELHNQSCPISHSDFRRILSNLFSNSVKFTSSGSVTVRLDLGSCDLPTCRHKDVQHTCLRMEVEDTGPGIPPTLLGRVREQFFKTDVDTQGVGLGLSVVDRIVDDHGGRLEILSESDNGTKVTVLLCNRTGSVCHVQSARTRQEGKVMHNKTFSISDALPAEVSSSLKSYCETFGMSCSTSEDCDIRLVSAETSTRGAFNDIHISKVPMTDLQSGAIRAELSMPIGPDKLWRTLVRALSPSEETGGLLEKLDLNHVSQIKDESSTSDKNTVDAKASQVAATIDPLSPQKASSKSEPLTCLVVDDNLINVKILCALLKRRGYLYACANDGVEAVEMVTSRSSEDQFDIVLMDINMPRMNGVEASRRIRAYQQENKYPESLIIAVSGCSEAEQRAAIAHGMVHFFKKPIDLKNLGVFITEHESYLRERRAPSPIQSAA